MSIETNVLLVEASKLPSALEEQLSRRDVFTEHAAVSDLQQVLPLVVPDLAVFSGESDLPTSIATLGSIRPLPPMVVIANRATIRRLKAEAHIEIKGLIPQDLPVAAIAHRIATMARRSAQGEPLENKTAAGANPPAAPRGSFAAKPLAGNRAVHTVHQKSEDRPSENESGSTQTSSQTTQADAATTPRARKSAGIDKHNPSENEDAKERAKKQRRELEKKRYDDARRKRAKDAQLKAEERRKEAEQRRKNTAMEREEQRQARAKRLKNRASQRPPPPPPSKPPPRREDEIRLAPPSGPVAASRCEKPSDDLPDTSEEPVVEAPHRFDDELSKVAPLPVELRIPLSQTRSQMPTIRLALLDTDLTRADSISAALRRSGMEVLPLTPSIATTRWPMIRRFAPQGLIVDEKSMIRESGEWVETFRGDLFLRHVPLIVLRLSRLFRDDKSGVDLDPLLHLVEPLGKEEFALLGKLAPAHQVDFKLSQVTPYRLVQMLTEQDRNTRLDCRANRDRIVWPLGPGYAGRAKLLKVGSEKVMAKLSPEDAMLWLLSHEDCQVSVHEHTEPLAHASESQDSTLLLRQMTEAVGAPSRHRSVPPNPQSAPLSTPPSPSPSGALPTSVTALPSAPTAESTSAPTLRASAVAEIPPEQDVPFSLPGVPERTLAKRGAEHARALLKKGREGWAWYQDALSPLRNKVPAKLLLVLSIALPAGIVVLALALSFSSPKTEAAPAKEVELEHAGLNEPPSSKQKSEKTIEQDVPAPKLSKEKQVEARTTTEERPVDLWKIAEKTDVSSCEETLGSAAPQAESKSRAATYWKQARRKLMLGKTDEALEMMCLSGLYDPEGPATEGLAEYYLGKRSLGEAERWIKLSLKADSSRRKSQELQGDIESQKGNVEEARNIWLDTMRLVGDEERKLQIISRKLMADARLAVRGGDLPRAERELRRAATLAPKSAPAAAQLAELFLQRSQLPAALAWVKRARQLDPNLSSTLILAGRIAEKEGKTDEAREFYKSVPRGDSHYKQAQTRLGQLPTE